MAFCLTLKLGGSRLSGSHTAADSAAAAAAAAAVASHLCTALPLPDSFMDTEHHLSCTRICLESPDHNTKCKQPATLPYNRKTSSKKKAFGDVLKQEMFYIQSEVVKEIQHRLMWRVLMWCLFTKLYPLGVFYRLHLLYIQYTNYWGNEECEQRNIPL